MTNSSFRSCTLGCLLGLVTNLVLMTPSDAQILYQLSNRKFFTPEQKIATRTLTGPAYPQALALRASGE